MKLLGPDGEPVPSAAAAAHGVQALASSVIKGLNSMPRMRVHLDACHEHLLKKGEKPTGPQADTLATLKLVADFQDRAEQLVDELRTRAAQSGADTVAELRVEDVE